MTVQPDAGLRDETRFRRQLLVRLGIDTVDGTEITIVEVDELEDVEDVQALGDIVSRLEAQVDRAPICVELPLGTVDALLQHPEEEHRELRGVQPSGMARERSGEEIEMPEIVVRQLVCDDERNGLLMRASLEEPPREVDVFSRRGERVEGIEPRHHTNEALFRRPLRLQPLGDSANAIGHEAMLLNVRARGNLTV
jgi:hypothetical protein